MMEIKAYNKWSVDGITVKDRGLVNYISLDTKIVPKTGGRNIGVKFHKGKVFVVERLINKLMIPGHKGKKHHKTSYSITGKAATTFRIVEETFKLVEQRTKKNPIEILVGAVENSAPREEIITIEYGGARYPKAVECAPQRRVDLALRNIVQGAYGKSFNSRKKIVSTLAEELIDAYELNPHSHAIAKKNELERQADASR